MKTLTYALAACAAFGGGSQLAAQDIEALPGEEETVFDDNWLSVGVGVVYSPSYNGSDDYVFSPIPVVQGRLGPVGISPRARGVTFDFVNDQGEGTTLSAGVAVGLNRNRAAQIEDAVVLSYGELDTAIEIGPSVGVRFPELLNPYDSLSFSVDTVFDVAGAHDGIVVSPTMTYFTPVSRGAAVSLSVGASYVDDDYANYYYSVPGGGPLPAFQADGGWERLGVNLLAGIDLNGNLADGGLAIIVMGGYSRMLGDAKRSPFTSIRGDADQWMGTLGIGYTF
jgi:outer membrane scaffolding protein for murein synthesis (MipA/OmpV family)